MNIDLVNKYLELIENITGRPYLDASGEIIESLKWLYQCNYILSYSIVLFQIIFILFIVLALPVVIVLLFTYERRRNRW